MKGRVYLSQSDKKIGGVCGGIAERFGLESSILRILLVLSVLLFKGLPVLIYFIFIFCIYYYSIV